MTAESKSPTGPRHAPPNARRIAARVLERVERDGAFAAASLDTEIARHPQLDSRDRALATEIVYGVLRAREALVARLSALAARGLPDDGVFLAHLLVAAYQILLLDRIPVHAAVDAGVTGIKEARGPKLAGFANALLRKLATQPKLVREQAVLESAPAWLVAELETTLGAVEARALLGATESNAEDHRTPVRVVSGRPLPAWLAAADLGKVSPLARLVPRGGDLRAREGFAEGAFVMQEEGAQVVGLALGARPGERVLDACAGRGQKTTLLRERVGADADLWAADLYADKLRALENEHRRLGLAAPHTCAVDLSVGTGDLPDGFDRVLVDAPCTGSGTLRHRPEIARRLTKEDSRRLGELGEAILRNAASRAKPGGRVVFAVCSVLPEECERVIERVSDVLEPAPFDAPELASVIAPATAMLRLTPFQHGTDGFFLASLRRRS